MSTLLVAARNPLFVLVIVVAGATGLLIHPWLLPLGLVVYVASVILASRDAALLSQVAGQAKRRGLTSSTFRAVMEEIERSQQEVEQALKQAGGVVAERLSQTVAPQTRELVDKAHTLAYKGQDIEAYLVRVNYYQLQNQINDLDARMQRTTDAYTIDQLQGTRKALVEQLDNARVLETYIGRIRSQLENIDANLDAIPAQILRLRASDVDASMASSQVAQNLSDLNADMSAFVSMLDTALGQTSAGASP